MCHYHFFSLRRSKWIFDKIFSMNLRVCAYPKAKLSPSERSIFLIWYGVESMYVVDDGKRREIFISLNSSNAWCERNQFHKPMHRSDDSSYCDWNRLDWFVIDWWSLQVHHGTFWASSWNLTVDMKKKINSHKNSCIIFDLR